VAVLVGFACWGMDLVTARARRWAAQADEAAPPPGGVVALGPGGIRARGLVVGLALTVPSAAAGLAARTRSAVAPAARVAAVLARPALRLPPVRRGVRAAADLRLRMAVTLSRIAAAGEREAARCERMAQMAAAEVYQEALAAVGRASGVREVLIEQSAGLAGEFLAEARQRSEEADARVESTTRSLLGRLLGGRPGRGRRREAGRAAEGPATPAPAGRRSS
jgi:hypothetical protein